ncbi:MAG: hypothetical protein H6592_15065 [Flavobacteriales bacterium]|nr:hypothetical protein [Flavobacteriales bacterium]
MSSDNVVHNSNNIQFLECVISSNLSLGGSTNCKIISCILTGNVYDGSSLTVENSFVQGASLSPSSTQACRNCNFRGNIFSSNPAYYGSSSSPNYLVKNVLAGSIASTNPSVLISSGNIENADLSQVFVAYTTGYDPTDDLHLTPGSLAIGAGPGGTDCGIYGGANPWKDGGLPANPHVMQKAIGATTNAQGELPVTIRVAAQGN